MNVGKLLTKAAQSFPENLAVSFGDLRRNYRDFDSRANRFANALYALDVERGDNVAILTYNCPEMLEAIFGCFKAGCGAVPINFRLHPREFAYIINHCEAKAVLISPEFNESILEYRGQFPSVAHIVALAGACNEILDYEALVSAQSPNFIDAEVTCEDVAWLFYTSGTTGRPKGAMLTHRNLLAMTMSFYADMCPGFGFAEVALHAAPLSHGCGLYAIPNVAKAAANVILESRSFDPEIVLRTVEQHKVTNMFAAPTMVKMLIDCPKLNRCDFSSMKALIYGGGPMLADDLKATIRKLGPCLVQLYGQGECPMNITYLPHHDHVCEGTPEQTRRLSSAGIAHTDVEVRIFDSDDHDLGTGKMGEIVVRSDIVMKGYWRDPEASAETLRNGWLHTGDLGYIDEDGYLFIMDRSKDLIITGGENVYPREIEEIIVEHPAVREVAVIGVPDPRWGESIKAVVSLLPDMSATEEELIQLCRKSIASFKKPHSVDFIDELPKNATGKILKKELRSRYSTND